MCKRNSQDKSKASTGCVRESPEVRKEASMGCVRESHEIRKEASTGCVRETHQKGSVGPLKTATSEDDSSSSRRSPTKVRVDGVLVDVEGFSHPRRSTPSSRPQVPPKPKFQTGRARRRGT